MPCPFTGPKMFCAGPKIWLHIVTLHKLLCWHKKQILLNANHLFVWHKIGPAQNILGPVKGQGINQTLMFKIGGDRLLHYLLINMEILFNADANCKIIYFLNFPSDTNTTMFRTRSRNPIKLQPNKKSSRLWNPWNTTLRNSQKKETLAKMRLYGRHFTHYSYWKCKFSNKWLPGLEKIGVDSYWPCCWSLWTYDPTHKRHISNSYRLFFVRSDRSTH